MKNLQRGCKKTLLKAKTSYVNLLMQQQHVWQLEKREIFPVTEKVYLKAEECPESLRTANGQNQKNASSTLSKVTPQVVQQRVAVIPDTKQYSRSEGKF